MRGKVQQLTVACIAAIAWLAPGCREARPGRLIAGVTIVDFENSCAFDSPPGTSCTIARMLSVIIQEEGGRDVHLESVSGVLWDTRGMQDMHAVPAVLSSDDIRVAVGTSVVPAHGQLSIPYKLGFTIVRPYILGPLTAMVSVRGRDTAENVIEANSEAL